MQQGRLQNIANEVMKDVLEQKMLEFAQEQNNADCDGSTECIVSKAKAFDWEGAFYEAFSLARKFNSMVDYTKAIADYDRKYDEHESNSEDDIKRGLAGFLYATGEEEAVSFIDTMMSGMPELIKARALRDAATAYAYITQDWDGALELHKKNVKNLDEFDSPDTLFFDVIRSARKVMDKKGYIAEWQAELPASIKASTQRQKHIESFIAKANI